MLFEIIGWVGSVLIVWAYFQVSRKVWPPDSLRYQLMNVAGALALVLYGWYKVAYASVLLNAVWLAVGVIAIVAIVHTLRRRSRVTKRRRS